MAFSVSEFNTKFLDEGFVRQSNFEVEITGLPGYPQSTVHRVDSIEIPGRTILTVDDYSPHGYGPKFKIPYDTIFQPITMTLYDTKDMSLWKAFKQWQESAVTLNPGEGLKISYYDDFIQNVGVTIRIFPDDSQDKILEITLIDPFPNLVSPLNFTWGSDEFSKLTVQLQYLNFEVK
jgi:hypothetical protein